jgi:polyferredoxin
VLRDRNPLFITLADGSIRNGYTIKILNKYHREGVFDLRIEGLTGAEIKLGGAADSIRVPSDSLKSFRIFVSTPAAGIAAETTSIRFILRERESGETSANDSQFRGPKR